VGGARFHYSDQEEFVDTVYLGAWNKIVFDQIGCFDEELVRDQDDELNYRLRALGGKILLSPKIKSIYYNRSTPQSLWRQYFQYGFWKVRVLQKHPGQMQPRQFIPLIFMLSLMISGALAVFTLFGKLSLALIVIAYLSANIAASVWTAAKQGWGYLFPLPLVYAILHLSYGLGFLVGLLRFMHRWGDKTGLVPEFHRADA
jgi:GT2 family glycosyltransferase